MNRYNESLYFRDLNKHETLIPVEEQLLLRRIKTGDQAAIKRLVLGNLRFVISVARKYQGRGLPLLDLVNEGNIGLYKAAKRFDASKDVKFISYAVWWIRQSILQALAQDGRVVRLPLNKIGEINKIKKANIYLEQQHQRTPNSSEIAAELDLSIQAVKISMRNTGRSVSMDAPFREGENDSNLYDVLQYEQSPQPDDNLIKESLNTEIDRALNTLSGRESSVLKLNFGLNGHRKMSLSEIGELFDLSRERVRQIREKAIRSLRDKSKNKVLINYLG